MRTSAHAGGSRALHRNRIMLVTPTRIAYRSLFGRPGLRTFGAWFFYIAIDQPFEIACGDAAPAQQWIALVPPYVPHRVSTPDRYLAQVLLEAETIADGTQLGALIEDSDRAADTRRRILCAFDRPLQEPSVFDQHFFGVELTKRTLDSRVAVAIRAISEPGGHILLADDFAHKAGLSVSRYTHLFTREMGVSFRRVRAWKRARGLLPLVAQEASLVNVALDTGYADSTHFCHSIRQFYGYKPSDIFSGSRRLAVVAQWSHQAAA
ncbi:MAG: helix-turn-helix domain-containing protein [Panacagrimonas sp.]